MANGKSEIIKRPKVADGAVDNRGYPGTGAGIKVGRGDGKNLRADIYPSAIRSSLFSDPGISGCQEYTQDGLASGLCRGGTDYHCLKSLTEEKNNRDSSGAAGSHSRRDDRSKK